MRIFADKNIRRLFALLTAALIIAAALVQAAAYYLCGRFSFILLSISLASGGAVIALLFAFFKKHDRMLETASAEIDRILSGDSDRRLNSDDDGELGFLFHKINTLAAVLSTQAQREQRRGEFLKELISDISHQMKTPLAALNIYNGLIAESDSADTVKQFAASSERELDRIDALVKSLLTLARLNAGAVILKKTDENVSDIMENIRERFLCRARQEGKTIELAGGGDDTLFCDRGWLSEAFGNIVKNALDHTPCGGEIKIDWFAGASTVTVTISDNGSGIHPDDISHVFKRFYRSRYSTDNQGLGLGLPIAKSIIEAHSGTIEAQSEPGKGTVFTMIFVKEPSRELSE